MRSLALAVLLLLFSGCVLKDAYVGRKVAPAHNQSQRDVGTASDVLGGADESTDKDDVIEAND